MALRSFNAVFCPACQHFKPDLFYFTNSLFPQHDYLCLSCCDEVIIDFQYSNRGCPKCESDLILPVSKFIKTKEYSYVKEYSTCRMCRHNFYVPYQEEVDKYQRKLLDSKLKRSTDAAPRSKKLKGGSSLSQG